METFTMSRKEVLRAGLVRAALAGKITNAEGAGALHLTVRQFKRLKARVRTEGVAGLPHRARGRPGRRHLGADLREQVVTLMTTVYDGFNDVHLTEKLRERHALPVSRATVRRLRLALGRPARRRRRAPKHRSRRDRAPALGQLAQLDGSPCAWFEERGPVSTLHGVIDDATSLPLALGFRPTEDLHGYFTVLRQVCRTYGVPTTLYGDRLNVFQRNDHHWTLEEELRGKQDPTHFGRALQDLGVGFIAAQSPQAKGRIERLWATLQDGLTSELRLRGIATLEAANAYLPEFLADFQRRFPTPPASPTAAWRPVPRDLELILSCRYRRVVARDNTVQLGGRWLQVPPGPGGASYAGRRLEVRELLDGRLVVMLDGRPLVTQPSPSPDFVLTPRTAPSADRRPHAASPRPMSATAAGPCAARHAPRCSANATTAASPLAAGLQTRNAAVPSHQGVTFSLNSYGDIFTGQRHVRARRCSQNRSSGVAEVRLTLDPPPASPDHSRAMKPFGDEVVFITGASSGIGAALARRFAREGAAVALTARRVERLHALATELTADGARVVVTPCDVTVDEEVERAMGRARQALGRLSIVVANAGFGVVGRVDRLTLEDYRRQFETNVFGVLRTIYAGLDDLKHTHGRLVILGSVSGHVGFPGSSAYSMSKFSVRALAQALDGELARDGVSVTLISPGFVDSEIHQVDNRGIHHPDTRRHAPAWLVMPADRAAGIIVRAVARRRREAVITAHGKLTVCLQRLAPGLLAWVMRRAGVRGRPEPGRA